MTASGGQAATVQTATGPVPVEELGVTLTHEHLGNDARKVVGEPADAGLAFLRDAQVRPELAWLLREHPYSCLDHCVLDDTEAVLADLTAFGAAGGATVVDVTPPGLGRDPLRLRSLSERSGVRVVLGSGWYLQDYHPPGFATSDERTLAAELVTELTDGVGDTAIRPGVIGEIGVSPDFTAAERLALRAAARAQAQTGVPLYVHLPGWQRRAHEVLDIVLGEYPVAPGSVVLCHMDPSGADPDYQRSVAARGVWLEFDMVGMPFRFPGEGQSPPPSDTARAIAGLIETGHGGQLLLSHDLFLKSMLTRYGGNGLNYVPTLFLDRLAEHGVDRAEAAELLRANPARLFRGH
jgi:phosphotriesterase-related protein